MAAVGPARRRLPTEVPQNLRLPHPFADLRVAFPGILVVKGPPWDAANTNGDTAVARLCASMEADDPLCAFPWVVVVDDSEFTARSEANFLWVTFTRSNPAADVHGIAAFTHQKHWGCHGSLVIDARAKPHHAPPLEPDPQVARRVDALAARGGPLHGIV
jgi:4-hydroxy-3-polyprenylbenzoate decarboxylase